jgi:hypothetical protein
VVHNLCIICIYINIHIQRQIVNQFLNALMNKSEKIMKAFGGNEQIVEVLEIGVIFSIMFF